MCTAFIHKGHDVIFGFNMDINKGAFDYQLYATADWFGVGLPADLRVLADSQGSVPSFYRVSDGVRKIQGVNRHGIFTACLNNMGPNKAPFRITEDACSIDQVMDDLLSGRRSLEDARRFAEEKALVTIPTGAVDVPPPGFHSLSAAPTGGILLLEPGNGYAVLQGKYAVMTNFPLLEPIPSLTDETASYYGKDRYDTALRMLQSAPDAFTPENGLDILRATRQTGHWAPRVSFVYSCSEKTVYYCLEGDFDHISTHQFE